MYSVPRVISVISGRKVGPPVPSMYVIHLARHLLLRSIKHSLLGGGYVLGLFFSLLFCGVLLNYDLLYVRYKISVTAVRIASLVICFDMPCIIGGAVVSGYIHVKLFNVVASFVGTGIAD